MTPRPGYLSTYFSLAELTATSHRNIDNTCPPEILPALADTARRGDRVRLLLGFPMIVTSGYRCQELNAAVGSRPTSAHAQGRALDFICPGFGSPLEVCRAILAASGPDVSPASRITFDQLIEEGTWIHISFDPRMRGQVLTMRGGRYTQGIGA